MSLFNVLINKNDTITSTIPMNKIDTLADRLRQITDDADRLNKKMRKQAWCNARVMRRMHRY